MIADKTRNAVPVLPNEILQIIKDFSAKTKYYPAIKQIKLYGSYSRNQWTKQSDVDIAVFVEEREEDSIREIYKALGLICGNYSKDVQVQVFSESELLDPMGIVEEVAVYGIDIKTLI